MYLSFASIANDCTITLGHLKWYIPPDTGLEPGHAASSERFSLATRLRPIFRVIALQVGKIGWLIIIVDSAEIAQLGER